MVLCENRASRVASRRIRKTAVMKTPKLLDAGWNFSRAIFRASSPARRDGAHNRPAWHEVKQGVPDA
jgi:hypothetical protein